MSGKPITVTISIGGEDRAVSAELVLSHLAKALAGQAITGLSTVVMASDGSVAINGLNLYTPKPARMSKPNYPRRDKNRLNGEIQGEKP